MWGRGSFESLRAWFGLFAGRCGLLGLAAALMAVAPLGAQESAVNTPVMRYIDYPQTASKVQPLKAAGVPKWATLDLQLRGRFENQSSDNYVTGNEQAYLLTRIWAGLEVRPAKWALGYIQFMDEHALGLPTKYKSPNMLDTFDARQAFLELRAKNMQLITGRQELRYGSERLVGISDWTNVSRTWDGFLGRIGDKNRLDVFSTSVVAVHPTSLDKHGAGLTFHGAVGTFGTWVPHTVVQPFLYVKALQRVQGRQGLYGTQTSVTPGAEVASTLPGGLSFDVLGALQRGSYANDSVSAAAGYAKVGYTAGRLGAKPRLGVEFDYASGNPQGDPGREGTFDQQYPSNHNAFGLTDLFGFQNIKQERINLDFAPTKHFSALIQQEWLQTASRSDSIYNGAAGIVVKTPAAGFLSGDIGREFDASGKYAIGSYLLAQAGVGHFSPGSAMRENTHGQPLTLVYLSLTYRFKLNAENGTP